MNLISGAISSVKDFVSKGHARSIKAKKNIVASFLVRGLSIGVSFYLVPLTLGYLNPTKYGIWLTLSSVVGWFSMLDVGLGHGLRNRLAEALAEDNIKLAKSYVSTTYAIIVIIVLAVCLIFVSINPFLDWAFLLNAPSDLKKELNLLALGVFCFFSLQFVFKLIGTILTAHQSPAWKNFLAVLGQFLALVIIFVLTKVTSESILYLGLAMTFSPVAVLFIANLIFFNTRYQALRPAWIDVNFKHAKHLMNIGFKFFFLNISVIVLLSTDNMIISQVLDPIEVPPYHIARKYFGLIWMGFVIIIGPLWTAFTDAWIKGEIKWIKNVIRRMIQIWLVSLILAAVMLVIAPYFYTFWVGDKLTVPFELSLAMACFVVLNSFNNIFVYFINGVGKLRLQIYASVVAVVLNIPLSIFLAKYMGLGSTGVILATLVSILISIVLHTIQYHKIINNKATGIWDK